MAMVRISSACRYAPLYRLFTLSPRPEDSTALRSGSITILNRVGDSFILGGQ